jgi:hypothetical protein
LIGRAPHYFETTQLSRSIVATLRARHPGAV